MSAKVSTQILTPIVEQLRIAGVRAQPILHEIGIDRTRLYDVNHYVSLNEYVDFFEKAATAADNLHFGLHCGRDMDSESLGAISFLFMSASVLKDAFRGLTEYLDALQTGTVNGLSIENDEARFCYRLADDTIAPRRHDAEYSISATFHLISRYLGKSFKPHEVHFEHQRSGNHKTYEDFFGCDVFFDQPTNMIAFDAELLTVSAPSLSNKLYPIIAAHLQERIDQQSKPLALAERVAKLIDTAELTQGINASRIADMLAMSESTLARRLKAEGTTFVQVLTQKRMGIAKRLLLHSEQSIAEIALAVGYAENASFTRAFKAHCGVTPGKYRISGPNDLR